MGAAVSRFGIDFASTLSQAQAGDQVAFDSIYGLLADTLFRYLYARCGDRALAEELTSDLWVRVVEHLPSFKIPNCDPEVVFVAWLYTIARNLLADTYRRRRLEVAPLNDTITSHEVSPDDRVIINDEIHELQLALEQLTAEQREVILLRFIEQRSNSEVAQLTGRSENAVKVMQHRALTSLARLLGGKRKTSKVTTS